MPINANKCYAFLFPGEVALAVNSCFLKTLVVFRGFTRLNTVAVWYYLYSAFHSNWTVQHKNNFSIHTSSSWNRAFNQNFSLLNSSRFMQLKDYKCTKVYLYIYDSLMTYFHNLGDRYCVVLILEDASYTDVCVKCQLK